MEENITEKRRCKKCGQLQTYVKIKTQERICKVCGHAEKINQED